MKPQEPSHRTPKQQEPSPTPKHKWTTFACIGKKTIYITNIFRQTDLRIAYCTNNTIHHLIHRIQHPDKFSSSRVYKLTCSDCKKACVGQTGGNFTVRYNKHKHAFWTNSTLPGSHNISMNKHTPLTPLKTPCKYYTTIGKVRTSTLSNVITFMLNTQPITT